MDEVCTYRTVLYHIIHHTLYCTVMHYSVEQLHVCTHTHTNAIIMTCVCVCMWLKESKIQAYHASMVADRGIHTQTPNEHTTSKCRLDPVRSIFIQYVHTHTLFFHCHLLLHSLWS